MRQHNYDYDAFISHAVEDKIPIANELCAKLERAGLRIWYSGKELGVGDSIEKTIENGLHRSRYGIVILSPTYLAKNWTIREFYTLLAKEIQEHKVILPVLYNITLDDLKKKDLLMADRFAVDADRGIDHVVERLVHEIRKPKLRRSRVAWFSRIWLVLILSLLANVAMIVKNVLPDENRETLAAAPAERLQGEFVHANLMHQMQDLFSQLNSCACDHQKPTRSPLLKTRMVRNQSGTLEVVDEESPANQTAPRRKSAGKMTMAVVFQIEAPTERESEFSDDASAVMQTIESSDDSPFVMVSNRHSEPQQLLSSCRQSANAAE